MTTPSNQADPYELDRLVDELAEREGDVDVDADYPLPLLEPLSHEHPLLRADNPSFDVEEFLLSRTHTSLSDLRSELKEYASLLKDELVQLINDDYEAFISLSIDLQGEGQRLEQLIAPMGTLRTEIETSRQGLLDAQAAIEYKLHERARLRQEKALLLLLQKISESLIRLETLLLIPPQEDADKVPIRSSIDIQVTNDYGERLRAGRAKHLYRVAAEYVQLGYHSEKAKMSHCAFVDAIQWRIDRVQETLSRDLDQVFSNSLAVVISPADLIPQERVLLISELTECLRTYDILDMKRQAEEILRIKVMQPFVEKTIFTGAMNVPQTPLLPPTPNLHRNANEARRTPTQPHFYIAEDNSRLPLLDDRDDILAAFYNNILRFVEQSLRQVMEIAAKVEVKQKSRSNAPLLQQVILGVDNGEASPRPSEDGTGGEVTSSHHFEVLANVVWAEIGRALMEEMGASIFSAGRPSEFKKHYTSTTTFISALEFLAPDVRSVEAMRNHPVYLAFERRWHLPVYFQLRWKEIVGDVEVELAKDLAANDLTTVGSKQALSVVGAINLIWSSDVFLAEVADRFWKLTLQLILRFTSWVSLSIPAREAPAPVASLREDRVNLAARSGSPALGGTSDADAGSSGHDEDTKIKKLAISITDIELFDTSVMASWINTIAEALVESEEEGNALLSVLQQTIKPLNDMIPSIATQIVLILSRKCSEPISQVKQVSGQVRAMNRRREAPNTPSPFIGEIFRPLKEFFNMGGAGKAGAGVGQTLKHKFGATWATEILQSVATRYAAHLESIRKNEEALRRLKKGVPRSGISLFGTGAGTAQDDQARDDERVRAQMVLDVARLGADAESFGVILSEVPAYTALTKLAAQNE